MGWVHGAAEHWRHWRGGRLGSPRWVFGPLGLGPGAGVAFYRSYEWLTASLPPHFSAAAMECWIGLSLDRPAGRYFLSLTGSAVESAGMGYGQASDRVLHPACARFPLQNHKFPPTLQGFEFDPMVILVFAFSNMAIPCLVSLCSIRVFSFLKMRCIENPKAVTRPSSAGRTGKVPTKVYKSHYFKKGFIPRTGRRVHLDICSSR